MFFCSEELADQLRQEDAFESLRSAQGTVFREAHGRKTLQLQIGGHSYFVKLHSGVGWGEIIKNLLQLRLPVLGAGTEWRAIQSLKQLGLATLSPVAFGSRGWNPATRKSFIVTKEIEDSTNLEELSAGWGQYPPKFKAKHQLISEVAAVSKKMHENGIFHRDYYLCHFLLQNNGGERHRLCLIDLHRALINPLQKRRWRIKDIAGLNFSARNSGLSKHDCFRFMQFYSGKNLRQCLSEDRVFWEKVEKRTARMTARDEIKRMKRLGIQQA